MARSGCCWLLLLLPALVALVGAGLTGAGHTAGGDALSHQDLVNAHKMQRSR